jgi:hypothetical protein
VGTIPEEVLLARDRKEKAARIEGDTALGTRLDDALRDIEERFDKLEAKTKALINGREVDSKALISTVQRVVTEPGFALAEEIKRLEAMVTEGSSTSLAYIEEINRVIATNEYALAEKITHLHAEITAKGGGVSMADVEVVLTAYATKTFAEAKKAEAITASYGYTDSAITTEHTAWAGADEAIASSVSSLDAQVNNAVTGLPVAHSRITSEHTAWTNANSAVASDVQTLDVQVNDAVTGLPRAHARVTEESDARIAADGAIHARWGVQVDVNGRVTGRIRLDGTEYTSTLDLEAGTIRLWNGSFPQAPFYLADGVVNMQNVRVGGLTIDSQKLSSGDVQIWSSFYDGLAVGNSGTGRFARIKQAPNTLPGFLLDDNGTLRGIFNLVNIGGAEYRSSLLVDGVTVTGGINAAQFITTAGWLKVNASGRLALESSGTASLSFTTNSVERWIVGGSDGHLKVMGDYDIRKVNSDSWSPALWDGSHVLEFRWSGGLQARVDRSTVVTITTT